MLQEKELHGMEQWKHKNGKFVIWWNKESNNWIIGEHLNQRTSTCSIMGPLNDNKLPTKINSWKYYFEKGKWFGKNKSDWIDATNVEIEVIDMISTNNCWINASKSELKFEQINFVKGNHFIINWTMQ